MRFFDQLLVIVASGGKAHHPAEIDAGCRQDLQLALHQAGDSGALLHRPGHTVSQKQAGPGPPQLRKKPSSFIWQGVLLSFPAYRLSTFA